ncbi:MAG: hypothetical protein MSG78_04600 [Clostridiales bacterium]|nr:hypothetical protein [Clostridiales bacterium]
MKRQNRYKIAVMAGICIMALSGCDNSVKVENNQRLVYGEVQKIVGNDVVLSRPYEEETDINQDIVQGDLNINQNTAQSDLMDSQDGMLEEETEPDAEVIASVQLPVGMKIHKGEAEISFTEIQEGDSLKILLQKDSSGIEVPVEAWVGELTEKEKKALQKEERTTAVAQEDQSSSNIEDYAEEESLPQKSSIQDDVLISE